MHADLVVVLGTWISLWLEFSVLIKKTIVILFYAEVLKNHMSHLSMFVLLIQVENSLFLFLYARMKVLVETYHASVLLALERC